MGVLDIEAQAAQPLTREPFDHLILDGFVRGETRAAIAADYPAIDKAGSFALEDLDVKGAVADLVAEMDAAPFRQAIERKFGVDLAGKVTTFTLRGMCGERDGDIHTDSKTKIITILVYLNDDWAPDGGRLRLLRNGHDLEDYVAEASPNFGSLVAFRRSDNSWHGHKRFIGAAPRAADELGHLRRRRPVAEAAPPPLRRRQAALAREDRERRRGLKRIARGAEPMARPPRSLLVFLALITLARLAAAAFVPLSEDEAYYRLWAQSLQLGYLDHPPMIAWFVRAGMTIAGDNALGVRLASVIATALSSLLVFDTASQLGLGGKGRGARGGLVQRHLHRRHRRCAGGAGLAEHPLLDRDAGLPGAHRRGWRLALVAGGRGDGQGWRPCRNTRRSSSPPACCSGWSPNPAAGGR